MQLDPEDLDRRSRELQRKLDAMREELTLTPEEFEELLCSYQRLAEEQGQPGRDELNDEQRTMKPPLIQALEQAVDNAAAEGLTFPMVQVMVSSSRAVVWAIEISEGPDGIHHRDLCHNLSGDPLGIGMATPIILYFSDRNGQTFQAGILSDPGGAQA